MKLDVLFLDAHLLVLNKPPGLLAQGDETGDQDLLSLARAFLEEQSGKAAPEFLGLVHRLDRPVSGVMLFARTSKAASRLSEQFRSNTPDKRYLAVVEGDCRGEGTRIDHLFKDRRKARVRVVRETHPRAQYAELKWRAVAQRSGLSLLTIELKTGRAHQIRVQLSRMGSPVLGDFRYGARRELDGRNLALHCYYLGVEHPLTKELMHWKAFPPPSWHGFFDREVPRVLAAP